MDSNNNNINSNGKLPNGLQREASPKSQQQRVRQANQGQNVARRQSNNNNSNGGAKPKLQREPDVEPTITNTNNSVNANNNANNGKKSKKKIIITVCGIVLTLAIGVPLTVMYIGNRLVERDALVVSLRNNIESLEEEISELEDAVADTTVQEVIKESSLQTVEGSLVPEFVSIDDKVIFPNKLELPDSNDDINNSNIMVGSKFKFIPSNNWIIKMQGATLYMSHPSKINGVLRSVSIAEAIKDEDEMKQLIQDFFVGFPSTTISYRKVFLGDKVAGMQGVANIEVDGKASVVTVGFAQKSENAI